MASCTFVALSGKNLRRKASRPLAALRGQTHSAAWLRVHSWFLVVKTSSARLRGHSWPLVVKNHHRKAS